MTLHKSILAWIFTLSIVLFPLHAVAEQLFINYNFSNPGTGAGIPGWITQTTGEYTFIPVTDTAVGHDTAPAMHLGSYLRPTPTQTIDPFLTRTSDLIQNVVIPRDALGTTLTFYYKWETTLDYIDPDMNCINISFNMTGMMGPLIPPISEPSTIIFKTPTPVPPAYWTEYRQYLELDNPSYWGQTVTAKFSVKNDQNPDYWLWMYVDDVCLDVRTATKTWTPTFTRTYTVTLTPTISATVTPTYTITKTFTITPTVTKTITITPQILPAGEVVVFPNPVSGDTAYFLYTLDAPASIVIDIYNLLGYRIAHLEDRNRPAIRNQKTSWDIRNIASGVYFYKFAIERPDGSRSVMESKKIVIAR